MNLQPVIDFLITAFVLFGIFFMAYCALRKQGFKETYYEIKEIMENKTKEVGEGLVYANR